LLLIPEVSLDFKLFSLRFKICLHCFRRLPYSLLHQKKRTITRGKRGGGKKGREVENIGMNMLYQILSDNC